MDRYLKDIIKQVKDDKFVSVEKHDDNLFCLYSEQAWRVKRAKTRLESELKDIIFFFGNDPNENVAFFAMEQKNVQ